MREALLRRAQGLLCSLDRGELIEHLDDALIAVLEASGVDDDACLSVCKRRRAQSVVEAGPDCRRHPQRGLAVVDTSGQQPKAL